MTLEESTCIESEPKSEREGLIMCKYKLDWPLVAETAIRYSGSAEFVQEIMLVNAKVARSQQYTTGGIKL